MTWNPFKDVRILSEREFKKLGLDKALTRTEWMEQLDPALTAEERIALSVEVYGPLAEHP